MSAIPKRKKLTEDEYLVIERDAEFKSEFYNGEMFAMAGASLPHNQLQTNLIGELHARLKGGKCLVFGSDMRVKVKRTGLYTYSDAAIACHPEFESKLGLETLTNPQVVFEILSKTTEGYDRGRKFAHYRTLPSFAEYVLVSQKEPLVEVFFRQGDGTWQLTPVRGREASVRLQSLGIELRLAEVYDRVEFPEIVPLK